MRSLVYVFATLLIFGCASVDEPAKESSVEPAPSPTTEAEPVVVAPEAAVPEERAAVDAESGLTADSTAEDLETGTPAAESVADTAMDGESTAGAAVDKETVEETVIDEATDDETKNMRVESEEAVEAREETADIEDVAGVAAKTEPAESHGEGPAVSTTDIGKDEGVAADNGETADPRDLSDGQDTDDGSPIVVFDSGAVPMAEPADGGSTVEPVLSSSDIHHPEVFFAEPEPPPLPDPLDGRQINSLVFARIGDGLLPVHRNGSALYLLHDLDGNGYNDVFTLAVRGDKREVAEFANVNDYTRLYRAEREAVRFYLRLFYQRNGTLEPADLVSLGERLVVDSFLPRTIVRSNNLPFVAAIVFTTPQGRIREWVIFSGGKPTRFSMQERTGEIPRIEDIDGDGVIDVIIYEESFEIGIGNETYLTLYRWDGSNYRRQATINTVRNLQAFLTESFALVQVEDWAGFSESALSDEFRSRVPVEDQQGFGVFRRVFSLAAVDVSFRNTLIGAEEDIKRAVYPEIRENPFIQRDDNGFFFPLTVRFESAGGRNHLYTARIYLLTDPFSGRQFSFGVPPE